MEANNDLPINSKESMKQKNYVFIWRKIRNKYILKQIFEYLNQKMFLKIMWLLSKVGRLSDEQLITVRFR